MTLDNRSAPGDRDTGKPSIHPDLTRPINWRSAASRHFATPVAPAIFTVNSNERPMSGGIHPLVQTARNL